MADNEDEDKQPPVYEDDEQDSGAFRWMSAIVVMLAVAGFFGLAWYAYRNGSDTVDEKDVELIQADKTPVKQAPANPGGMQIPNQDKTVYGLISGNAEKPVVERILPAPEEPMKRSSGGETETWMSDSVKNKASAEEGAPKNASAATPASSSDGDGSSPKDQFNPAKAVADSPAKPLAPAPAAAVQVAQATPPSPPVKPAASPTQASTTSAPVVPQPVVIPTPPAPVKVSPVAAPKKVAAETADDSDDSEDTKTSKPAVKTQSPPAGVRVQLGAYKSQGEAESNWAKIADEFSDELKNRKHYIVRADLGDKGVFYRLQVAPFDSSKDADQFCIDFVSAGQGCIVAKGK